ncbi:MAG TPA: cobaltochelatase subunit CobN, partial [Candidatus Sulfotelmatobacter sp.]|nr:cobaltochelatase subunit CobN [Candidatus Sulfotelmatobacter sp.]
MHLLAAAPGTIADGSAAVDLGQSQGDIVMLSAADSELAAFAAARAALGDGFPSLRLANLRRLGHNLSVDLYVERTLAGAKLVLVRLLGGLGYWPYGIERIAAACRAEGIKFAILPGDDQPDPTLAEIGTLPAAATHRLWQYCVHGGADNLRNALCYAASLIGGAAAWAEPAPLLRAGLYWPGRDRPGVADLRREWRAGAAVAAVVFYRALLQAGDLQPIDALIAALRARGLNPLPVYVASLKDPFSAGLVAAAFAEAAPAVVLNTVGFAVAGFAGDRHASPFAAADCPVLQVVLSGGTLAAWQESRRGLSASDLAMNVALPEVDGRVLSRAISFKAEARFDAATECPIVTHAVLADRVDFVADLASHWVRLRRTPAASRRIALILANYPNRDGRIGNGVGLDTPAGTVVLLQALRDAGYALGKSPADGAALMAQLLAGPTNALGAR